MNVLLSTHRAKLIPALAFLFLLVLGIPVVLAHHSGGYSHDSTIGISLPDWMGTLPDSLRISELSIPGTHDTMSRCGDMIVECQEMRLEQQLDAGIRALDIRARREWSHFDITHGCNLQGDDCGTLANHYEFEDPLCRTVNFLIAHPRETVLMRVQDAGCPVDARRSFEETYRDYVVNQREACQTPRGPIVFNDYIWDPDTSSNPTNPTLGEVRGKIVILDSFTLDGRYALDGTYERDR